MASIRFIKGYGETVDGSGDPVTTATVFRWASLSKGVAADMVALLANDGRLSLADPVEPLGLVAPPARTAMRRARRSPICCRTGSACSAMPQDASSRTGWIRAGCASSLASLHNICAPGTCHAYQNVAYDAASEIVERVTGRPYAEVVAERLFAPLGMRRRKHGPRRADARAELGAAASRRRDPRSRSRSPSLIIACRRPAASTARSRISRIWMMAQMGAAPDGVAAATCSSAVQAPRVRTPGETRRRRNYRRAHARTAYGLGWRVLDYAGPAGRSAIMAGSRGYRSMIMFDPALAERRGRAVERLEPAAQRDRI